MLRALEKAAKAKLDNIVFIKEYIHDVHEYFDKDELAGMYLNFSDPWPKERHHSRRLTAPQFLEVYKNILAKNGRRRSSPRTTATIPSGIQLKPARSSPFSTSAPSCVSCRGPSRRSWPAIREVFLAAGNGLAAGLFLQQATHGEMTATAWLAEDEEVVAGTSDVDGKAHGLFGPRLAKAVPRIRQIGRGNEIERSRIAGAVKQFRFEGIHVV